GEPVSVKPGANVSRASVRKRVGGEQSRDLLLIVQEASDHSHKPAILSRRAQSREPHLPIQSRLMWCAPAGNPIQLAWLPFELVRGPLNAIVTSFNNDLATILGHDPEQTVTAADPERIHPFGDAGDKAGHFSVL